VKQFHIIHTPSRCHPRMPGVAAADYVIISFHFPWHMNLFEKRVLQRHPMKLPASRLAI